MEIEMVAKLVAERAQKRLTAVMMARVLAFVEVQGLNPRGKAYYPDIVSAR